MGNVFIHVTMSLDGFIARLDDSVDWGFKYGSDEMASQSVNEIGAVVMGHKGFGDSEVDISPDRLPYGGQAKVPQFVVTHKPRDPVVIAGLTFHFVGSPEQAVMQAKVAAGEKNVALLGASIDQQCLDAGLVDEIMIHLVPVVLGEGIRLFEHLHNTPIELERTQIVSTAGITSFRFRVLK